MVVFASCNLIRLSQGTAFAFAGARSRSVSAATSGIAFPKDIMPIESRVHDERHCVDPIAP